MSTNIAEDVPKKRMGPRSSHSFSRMETSTPFSRSRSRTVHGFAVPHSAAASPLLSSDQESVREGVDVFEKRGSADSGPENATDKVDPSFSQSQSLPSLVDELPIELISLTDRYLNLFFTYLATGLTFCK